VSSSVTAEAAQAALSARAPATRGAGSSASDEDALQLLIDESATFHLFVDPARGQSVGFRSAARVVGFEAVAPIRRLELRLNPVASGMTGFNSIGDEVGEVSQRWTFVDHDYVAAPARRPPPVPLDRTQSQRFVIEEATFRLVTGDAFRVFGTGRTFPLPGGRLILGAVGNVIEGAGIFARALGNITLAGDLSDDGVFRGHVMVRFVDFARTLRSNAVPALSGTGVYEEGVTYLTWIAQKSHDADQVNTFSLTRQGVPRGLNIPVRLTRVWTDFSITNGFRATPLRTGEVIGREIGFGKEARPRTPEMGTAQTPFQFEGVSRYTFFNGAGQAVGTLTANVLEGRSIRLAIPGAPDAPGLRFGYFGPIVTGTGCFKGIDGMLYGTAGSVFAPPPAIHVISNLYVARLHDPDGRWRAEVAD
jgi:hypothetical protein